MLNHVVHNNSNYSFRTYIYLWANCGLQTTGWETLQVCHSVCSSFLTKHLKYFVNIFAPKNSQKIEVTSIKSGWLTKGINISGQRLRLLSLLKKKMSLSSKTLNYIKKYQITYKKVISEAWKRIWQNYFKVNKPYQGIMANNKKWIRELSKNKSEHFFKNRFHDSYKSIN
jgi:hypothetical protein